ncbi:hypothetical protein ACIBH1_46895 [Nonomuraea sp. NPDC050663]|uniref:hypothetical protein n=1 Tax=Nonomuraea sp. NPDC050663 TaxID=3364370 RepID=UPI0037B1EBC3
MSREHDLTQHAAEESGKRVHGIWGDHIVGTIVAGDIGTGRWIVRSDDGTEREIAGCHLQEIPPESPAARTTPSPATASAPVSSPRRSWTR